MCLILCDSLLYPSQLFSNNLKHRGKHFKVKKANAILRVGPELGISGSLAKPRHKISHMYLPYVILHTWTHARHSASAWYLYLSIILSLNSSTDIDSAASEKLTYMQRSIHWASTSFGIPTMFKDPVYISRCLLQKLRPSTAIM